MNLLSNKKIVIMGGTTGIGLSAAKAFIHEGAKLIAVGKDTADIDDVQKMLGKDAAVIGADATHAGTAIHAIDLCMEKFGDFDGLYHIAGGSGRRMGDGPLHALSLEGWNKT